MTDNGWYAIKPNRPKLLALSEIQSDCPGFELGLLFLFDATLTNTSRMLFQIFVWWNPGAAIKKTENHPGNRFELARLNLLICLQVVLQLKRLGRPGLGETRLDHGLSMVEILSDLIRWNPFFILNLDKNVI